MGGEHRSQVDDMTDLPLLWFLHRDLGRFFEKCLPALFFFVQSRNQSFGQKNQRISYAAIFGLSNSSSQWPTLQK